MFGRITRKFHPRMTILLSPCSLRTSLGQYDHRPPVLRFGQLTRSFSAPARSSFLSFWLRLLRNTALRKGVMVAAVPQRFGVALGAPERASDCILFPQQRRILKC